MLLVAAKGIAVLYSSSISLTASLVDSALDLLSTFIILGTSWAIGMQTDKHLVRLVRSYEVHLTGSSQRARDGSSPSAWSVTSSSSLRSDRQLIFSVAMIASFVQVFIESFERARAPASGEVVDLSKVGIA